MNHKHKGDLFNQELKNEFLSVSNDAVKLNYRRMFYIVKPFEEKLNKDLNKFTLEEIEEILYSFKSSQRRTIESYCRMMSPYLKWCVKKGLIKEDVTTRISSKDFAKYVDSKVDIFTEHQVRRIEGLLVNYQDALIVRLMFLGVSGRRRSEIRNLKEQDADRVAKTMILTNSLEEDHNGFPLKTTTRIIEADDYTLRLVDMALSQDVYIKQNGELLISPNPKLTPYFFLEDNGRVIKPSRREGFNDGGQPITSAAIAGRFKRLSNYLGYGEISFKKLQQSGMLFYAHKICKDNKVTDRDIKMIANQYNLPVNYAIRDVVNEHTLNKYYPLAGDR